MGVEPLSHVPGVVTLKDIGRAVVVDHVAVAFAGGVADGVEFPGNFAHVADRDVPRPLAIVVHPVHLKRV